jgi:hypothetical protein
MNKRALSLYLLFKNNEKMTISLLTLLFFVTSWLQGSHAIGEWTFVCFPNIKKIITITLLVLMVISISIHYRKIYWLFFFLWIVGAYLSWTYLY